MQPEEPERTDERPLLAVEGLTRDFAVVRALHEVSLAFRRGEVHGIVGENGAGKSTLVKVISGLYRPTAGRILHRGEEVRVSDPADALERGIAMVHQELNLVDTLSAADNIFLGREPSRRGLIDRRATIKGAGEALERVGAEFHPATPVGDLSVAQKQMVEVARALNCEAQLLILDEPTAVLPGPDAERLFHLIEGLSDEGVAVLYISHRLPEVLRICDRITVLRDGSVVETLERDQVGEGGATEEKLARLMVGRPMADHFARPEPAGQETVLQVEDLAAEGGVGGVSFEVRAGEILGFAGLVGAGRTETAEAIAGLRKRRDGTVRVGGEPVPPDRPREAVRRGIAYLSEDRRGRGLVTGRSVAENITLVSLPRYCHPFLSRKQEMEAAQTQVDRLDIRPANPRAPVDTLSGGNQQKVALARWLEMDPRVLILDEPTRGLDIGAKEEIYQLVRRLAAQGTACLFISSELNELLGTCHRIAVMRAGRIVRVLEGEQMTERNVMYHAAGVKEAAGA